MSYRNKTYVCFDADSDIRFYCLMKAWKQNDNTEFNFYNAHEINNIASCSSEETIKKRLRERMNNSKVLLVLVGEKTKNLYRFVRWEIMTALSMGLTVICVNLNHKRQIDQTLCPPILKDVLAIHVSFSPKIVQYALEGWPQQHAGLIKTHNKGPYFYEEKIYSSLGI